MFWVYILENIAGKFYIGHTHALEARLISHNRTDKLRGAFTRKNGPWELVWKEEHPARSSAMVRERQIKGMKSAKWIRAELLKGRVEEHNNIVLAETNKERRHYYEMLWETGSDVNSS